MKKLFKNFGSWLRRYGGIEQDGQDKYPIAAFLLWALFRRENLPEGIGGILVGRFLVPDVFQHWIIEGFTKESMRLCEERAKPSTVVDAKAVVSQADVIDGHGDLITKEALIKASEQFNNHLYRPVMFAFHDANPPIGAVVKTDVVGDFLYAQVKLDTRFPSVKELLDNHNWTLRLAGRIKAASMIDMQGQRARKFDEFEITSLSLLRAEDAVALKGPKRG